MGFKLLIDGQDYETIDFSVSEAATPLAAGDSTGAVGSISFSIPQPDPEVVPDHPINVFGPTYLLKRHVRLDDSRKGYTLGRIDTAQRSLTTSAIRLTAISRLGELNVHNIQAQPFIGNLSDAFEYYMSLAGVNFDFAVDPDVASTPVVFPGWFGELWFHLKQLAAAVDCDVSLVSGIILLRPIRERVATRGRDLDRDFQVGGGSLAQYIEAIQYNNRPITDELVYPPGGWSEEVTVINVNSGESIEETLELSASVSSITQPVMQTFVSHDHRDSSVFTVVGDDGLPIQPSAWSANGGSLSVEINPDTTSLTVKITAPTGLPNTDGEEIGVYGISLSSDSNTGRYSTLRILGTGVAFDKKTIRIPTGLTPAETSTEVGVTIDNPFLSEANEVYRAGIRAVRDYNGTSMQVSGSVVSINQLGDTGELVQRNYQYFQDLMEPRTYTQVQTLNSGKTYSQLHSEINSGLDDEFENQVFGNVNGARIWDEASRRWFRIRQGDLQPGPIGISAEDDLTHEDVQSYYDVSFPAPDTLVYSELQTFLSGRTYREVDLMGLRLPPPKVLSGTAYPDPQLFPELELFPEGE